MRLCRPGASASWARPRWTERTALTPSSARRASCGLVVTTSGCTAWPVALSMNRMRREEVADGGDGAATSRGCNANQTAARTPSREKHLEQFMQTKSSSFVNSPSAIGSSTQPLLFAGANYRSTRSAANKRPMAGVIQNNKIGAQIAGRARIYTSELADMVVLGPWLSCWPLIQATRTLRCSKSGVQLHVARALFTPVQIECI